jgi:hypothetical protein
MNLKKKGLFVAICKSCGNQYTKFKTTQTACSIDCALKLVAMKKEKVDSKIAKEAKKKQRERKIELKPLSFFRAKAQTAFNAYIRERDNGNGCISCGTKKDVQYCAGHYYTRGARPDLAFNEDNVHLQCNNYCNKNLSGNIEKYRPNLIAKIGEDRYLKLQERIDIKPTREYYSAVEKEYKQKLKELRNGSN